MNKTILVISFFVTGSAWAQTGDFTLQPSKQRTYLKVSGNGALKGTAFSRLFIGKNYRKEWADSITVPVLNLKTDLKGITPKKEGMANKPIPYI